MKHNLVIKVLLLAIVVLLTVNLIRPILSPSVTHAARRIQYKVAVYWELRNEQEFQSLLNDYAKEGWELVAIEPTQLGCFIFKK